MYVLVLLEYFVPSLAVFVSSRPCNTEVFYKPRQELKEMLQNTGSHLLNADVYNSIQRIQFTLKKGPPQGVVAQQTEGTLSF